MGGPRLTPEQIERAAAAFAAKANVSDAAREIGVSVSTLRDAFKRLRIAKNRHLHTEACERGIREHRERLMRFNSVIESVVGNAGELEPRDLASLVNSACKVGDTLLNFIDAERVRKQAALTRAKTRAETELLQRKIRGEHVERHEHSTDTALDDRIASLLSVARPEPTDTSAKG